MDLKPKLKAITKPHGFADLENAVIFEKLCSRWVIFHDHCLAAHVNSITGS